MERVIDLERTSSGFLDRAVTSAICTIHWPRETRRGVPVAVPIELVTVDHLTCGLLGFGITYESMLKDGDDLGGELVKVAFAKDPAEGEMIQGLLENGGIPSLLRPTGLNGPMLGIGLLPPGSQRVMVRASQANAAQRLLAETLVEDEQAWPDTANANHLEDVTGRKPRGYGLLGAYARIYLWSFGAIVVALGIFFLLRAA